MVKETRRQGSEVFIVDNSDSDRKVLNYLKEWTGIMVALVQPINYYCQSTFDSKDPKCVLLNLLTS